MPVYNREYYLEASIQSILNQDFKDFELLIIDDGSTDKSIEVITSFKDSRIRLLRNEVNKGVVYTRNRGLKEAKGEFILLLDSDDVALPGRLRKQLEFIEAREDAVITFSAYIAAYPNKKNSVRKIIEDTDLIRPMMLFKNCVVNGSCIIRKKVILDNNIKYRESFFYGEDYAFFVDALKYGNIYGQNEILSKFNYSSSNSITSSVTKYRDYITKNIMFSIRKKYLEDNNIYINDDQIMLICCVTAQPTLISSEQFKVFVNILEEIKFQNKKFNQEKLDSVLQEIINELLYFSQKISYIKKVGILLKYRNNYLNINTNMAKLFYYHIKFNIRNKLNFNLLRRISIE